MQAATQRLSCDVTVLSSELRYQDEQVDEMRRRVSEVEAAPAFLSPKDRYTKWAEENPALEVLRKRLDLDLG